MFPGRYWLLPTSTVESPNTYNAGTRCTSSARPAAAVAGFGAFIGHLFPVWLGFKGGKGVATYIGVLLGFAPVGVLVFAAVWLGAAKIWKFSSLAALLATLVVPIAHLVLGNTMAAGLTALLSVLVYLKHIPNIRRLLSGTESKIGAKG